MRIGFWIAGVVALMQFGSPVQAAEKFERKYTENSKQVKETSTKVEQTLTIAGMNVETKATSFQLSTVVAGPRDADGNLAIEETVTVLQADLELPGGMKLEFDSANPDKKSDNDLLSPLLDLYRAILQNPITTTVDRDNKVQEVKIANNPQEKLPQEFRSLLDPKRQQRDREQAWLFLPDKEVAAGAGWERDVEHDLGGGQTMSFKMKYVYAGPETKDGKTAHKFEVKHQAVTYAMDPTANPMVQVSKSDLKVEKSTGTILYDPATGETPLRDSTVKVTGTLTLVINGQEFPSNLDLTMTEKVTLQK